MSGFPLPGDGQAVVAAPAPGEGPGYWAGASCAAHDGEGGFVVAYRVRNGHDGNDETIVARSADGEQLTTVATLDESDFDAQRDGAPGARSHRDGRLAAVRVLRRPREQALVDRRARRRRRSKGSARRSRAPCSAATSARA